MRLKSLIAAWAWLVAGGENLAAQSQNNGERGAGYPEGVEEVGYRAVDGTDQPALFYAPGGEERVPLLVALHSWSGDYRQTASQPMAEWCLKNEWAFIHPNFRGPNRNPVACGSELAVSDIREAVSYAKGRARIGKVFLVGGSGGGHMALLMAGRAPELWAGVSAWVPITDLRQWYFDCRKSGRRYADEIVASCGGEPGTTPEVDREYRHRSPITYLGEPMVRRIPIDINAGIRDGHEGSVPIGHSLRGFNALVLEEDRISDEEISYFESESAVPSGLRQPREELLDPSYGQKAPLFRRTSGAVRVTIFDGGHEVIPEAALHYLWMAAQAE